MTAKELFDFILQMEKDHDQNEEYSTFSLHDVSDETINQAQQMLKEMGSLIQIVMPSKKQDLKVNLTFDQINP